MKYQHLISIVFVLLAGVSAALGQNNTISIPDVSVEKGKAISLPVNMDNTFDIVAVQFTVTVAEGLSLDPSSAVLTERSDGHSIVFKSIEANKYMAMVFSSDNKAIIGRTGRLLSVALTAASNLEEGAELPLTMSDVVISARDGSNLATGFSAGKVTIATSPDLEVSQVATTETTVNPGGKFNINWTVANIGGLPTTAGWSEQVYLKNAQGATKLLGTLYYDKVMSVGAVVSRNAEINVPNVLSIDGECSAVVKLTPNSTAGEPSWLQDNNTAETTSTISVQKVLTISPDNANVEEASTQSIRFMLTRSGDASSDETFTITHDTDARIIMPETVIIEKGNPSIYFYAQVVANHALDNGSAVHFSISGGDYPEISSTINIDDDTFPSLSIASEVEDVTEGGSIQFTISTQRASDSDIEIRLTCDYSSLFRFPDAIAIPAGETSVTVTVEALEDDVPNVEKDVTFTATAEKHNPASFVAYLADNDVPSLQMEITPSAISESAGPLAVTATIRRTDNIDKVVSVMLSDDSEEGIYYGHQKITLEKGVAEATVNLGPIDNSIVDGERTYNITAAVWIASCGCSSGDGTSGGVVSVPLTVYDNDGPTLALTSTTSVLKEGGEIEVTVKHNTDNTSPLVVNIESDHDADLEYPSSVTIPAGHDAISFTIKSKENEQTGDSFTATINAKVDGYATGNLWFTVSDQTLPDAQIVDFKVLTDKVEAGGSVVAEMTVANTGSYGLPELTPVCVYIGNTSSAAATIYLRDNLNPGESIVITREITMPSSIGTFNVFAIVNEGGEVSELSSTNNSSKMVSVKTVAPFEVSAMSDKSIYKPGEKVLISGSITGSDVAEKAVEVYVINDNYRHTISAETDGNGNFAVEYEPYAGQMGHFVAGACYPKEGVRTEMFAFDYYGIKRVSNTAITCETLLGDTYSNKYGVSNPGNLSLTNVTVEVISKPDNCDVTVSCPSNVDANSIFDVEYVINSNAVSESSNWELIELLVKSDEGVLLPTTIYYYCRNKVGQLKADVARINTTMIKGASRDYPFSITNIGKGETGKIALELPSWINTATPREMASLEYGESATVILRLTPTEDMQLNVPVTGSIGINCSNGQGLSLPFFIEPVSESIGTMIIDVCDENTYYTAEQPHLAGASVIVSHPTSGETIASGTTGEDGTFRAVLPEGYYAVSVSAPGHNSYRNNLLVNPGVENLTTVNLSIEAITVDWKVEETTVQDEYSIVTTVKYETNVPVPVVELSMPNSIDAKALPEGESLIFYATLTNKGLITAEDVQLELPTGFRTLEFEALSNTEPFSLAPQQSVLIPVKVTHVNVSRAKNVARIRPIDDDPCASQVGTLYYWDCGTDRKWHRYGVALQLGSCRSDDPSTWDNSGNGTYGGGYNYSYGSVSGPGIGGGSYFDSSSNSSNVTTTQDEGCEPCQNRELMKWVECGLSFIPIYGCVQGTAACGREAFFEDEKGWRHNVGCTLTGIGCTMELCAATTVSTIVGAPVAAVCEVVGLVTNVIGCLIPFTEPCDREGASVRAKNVSTTALKEPDYLSDFRSKAEIPLMEITAWSGILTEIFGDKIWVDNTTLGELYDLLTELDFSDDEVLVADKFISFKPQRISKEQFDKFIDRLNNTDIIANGGSIESSNFIDDSKLRNLYEEIEECENQSIELGYQSTNEMWLTEAKACKDRLDEQSSSVCASITLQFSQKMVMTRQAFRGTLTVFNGNETTAMTDVKLTLTVKDEAGNIATSHEFQINPEMLNGFEGTLSLDGAWTLDPQQTGVATIMFIPTKYAAPTVERLYSFGGSLSYVDPFTGLTVTRDLMPVVLTVKPSPNLDLTYFMQRDIKGDDPLTVDVIEPCEEAEFALLINNVGYGDATDVRMFTEQPKIIDNEKGLPIEFELISSQLNGGEKNLALGGTVATEFGLIPAKSTAYAQWWIKSSLLGHFTTYNVEATHVTSYDNPDLSLLNEVNIHELIRSLEVENGNDKLVGFMTNDIVDANDTPDMIYLSNGEIEAVSMAQNVEISRMSDTDYALTVSFGTSGWHYGSVTDPTYGIAALKTVRRQSDGKEMPLRNFWQTDRTLRDGKDPLYENRIHFADNIASGSEETYVLTFEPTPELLLEVASIDNVPTEGSLSTAPISNVNVMFNKYVDPTTFTVDDIALAVQGVKQNVTSVGISTEDNKTFSLDFTELNKTVGNGYFVLTVNTAEVIDYEGFTGKNGKQVGWIMFRDGHVNVSTSVYPAAAGSVQKLDIPAEAPDPMKANNLIETVEYGSVLKLTTIDNEGYEFMNWTVNGEIVSTDRNLEYTVLEDTDIRANYTIKSYSVTVNDNAEGGSIIGSASGVYPYGDVLQLIANANEDYLFEGWVVNEQNVEAGDTLSVVVNEAKEISANFRRYVFLQSLAMARGWNWVSSYVNEPVAVSSLWGGVTHIVGQFDEVIDDPVYGMVGGIEELLPGQAYKMEAAYDLMKSFKGHLHNLVEMPIELHTGWNWISYPFNEERGVGVALPSPSEGDVITSQYGFSEFANSCWEGTMTTLVPGNGYLYKSTADKTLTFDFNSNVAAKVSSLSVVTTGVDSYTSPIDVHKYPSTMNIIASISERQSGMSNEQCRVYAFAGNECRGESRLVNGNHYLTIYGNDATNISFVVENVSNGNTYIAKESIPFASEVVGSRNKPYILTLSELSGISDVMSDTHRKMHVYGIDGLLIYSDATPEMLKLLRPGIYIIDGQKFVVR